MGFVAQVCYHCRISPPRFLAVCRKRRLNQGSFVVLYFNLSALSDLYLVFACLFSCIVFVFSLLHVYFPVLLCFSVSVKWLAVKTASEMTYTVSGGALNSAQPTSCANCAGWTNVHVKTFMLNWYQLRPSLVAVVVVIWSDVFAHRAVTESINHLIDVCTVSAPGQKECDNALRQIQVLCFLSDKFFFEVDVGFSIVNLSEAYRIIWTESLLAISVYM